MLVSLDDGIIHQLQKLDIKNATLFTNSILRVDISSPNFTRPLILQLDTKESTNPTRVRWNTNLESLNDTLCYFISGIAHDSKEVERKVVSTLFEEIMASVFITLVEEQVQVF
jgi:hypothetical protein